MRLIPIFSTFIVATSLFFPAYAEQRSNITSNFLVSCMHTNTQAYPNLDEKKRQAYCSCAAQNFASYGGEGAILDKTFAAYGLRKEYSSDAEYRIKYAAARAQENCEKIIK